MAAAAAPGMGLGLPNRHRAQATNGNTPWPAAVPCSPRTAASGPPGMLTLIIRAVLFWLGFALPECAISIARAYVAIGVCYAMKRERNGDHLNYT